MDITQFGELHSRLFVFVCYLQSLQQAKTKNAKQAPNVAQDLSFSGADESKSALGATKMVISVAPLADLNHPSPSAQ